MAKPGLYANIHAKRKRIAAGSGEKMRKPGSAGALLQLTSNVLLKLQRKTNSKSLNQPMKSIIIAGLLLGAAHGAAQAGLMLTSKAALALPEVTTPVLQLTSTWVSKAVAGTSRAVLSAGS